MATDAETWLRERFERDIPAYAPWDTHVTIGNVDFNNGVEVWLDTEANRFVIRAQVEVDGSTYLGCIAQSRKYRPGEDWHRGNDLPDGPMTDETWWQILGAIIGYELQRSQRPKDAPEAASIDEGGFNAKHDALDAAAAANLKRDPTPQGMGIGDKRKGRMDAVIKAMGG